MNNNDLFMTELCMSRQTCCDVKFCDLIESLDWKLQPKDIL